MGNQAPPQYEIQRQLGRGGMGVVYQAFDKKHGRNVVLKTLTNESDAETLALFRRELAVLSQNSHPNIVDVYDSGEMEDGGYYKPYFVMPLLKGQTLQELVDNSSQALTVERVADIIMQVCRGLQSAHESGLIHRDLKPSNIFILEDYSVKIIDFGVAHLLDRNSTKGLKGTLLYMAPEQITRKPLSASVDIFALGVVGWEALTGRRPFDGHTERDIIDAILHYSPALVCELNATANQAVSLVIHKAMAKEPMHRFPSANLMAECMQKALRNEPIEYFSPDRIQPRLMRAKKAAAAGDHEFAQEILSGLEAEGFCSPEITTLRRMLEDEDRKTTVRHLLESASRRVQEQEYQLALQKLREIDDLDPGNTDAVAIKGLIEDRRHPQPVESEFAAPPAKIATAKSRTAKEVRMIDEALQAPRATDVKLSYSADMVQFFIQWGKKRYVRLRRKELPWREIFLPFAAVALLLMLAAGIRYLFFENRVALVTDPADAVIEIEGKQAASIPKLRPGSYNVVARARGYEPLIKTLAVEKGSPGSMTLKLTPLPPQLEVLAGLESASVSLDGEPAGEVTGGKYLLKGLSPGTHLVAVSREGVIRAVVRFNIVAGRAPYVVAGPFADGLHAMAVTWYRGAGRVFAPSSDAKVRLDDKDIAGSPIAGSIEMPVVAPGKHAFTFIAGFNEHRRNIEISDAPSLILVMWEFKHGISSQTTRKAEGLRAAISTVRKPVEKAVSPEPSVSR